MLVRRASPGPFAAAAATSPVLALPCPWLCRGMSDTGHSTDGRRCGLVSIGLALALIASVLLIEVSGVGRLPVSGEFRFGRLSIRLAAAEADSQGDSVELAQIGAPSPEAEADSAAGQGGEPAGPAQQAEAKAAEASSSNEPEQGTAAGQQGSLDAGQPPEAEHQQQREREPGGAQAGAGQAQEPEQAPAAGEQQPEEAQPTTAEGEEQGRAAEAEAQPEAQQPPEGGDQAAVGAEQPGRAGQPGTDASEARGAGGQQAAEGQLLGPEETPQGGDQQHVLQPSGPVFTCKDSGFCSVGQVRPWRGDVASNEALREMLGAVAFKKEVGWAERVPRARGGG